jgi:RimJ/RimL family protein N-acetyltransferase
VFAFDRMDRAFIRKAGFKYEIEKKMDIFKGNRFWSSLVYSLIGEEIDEFLLKGDKRGQ